MAIRSRPARVRTQDLLPYAFVIAPLAYLCVFMFWPLLRQIMMSFTDTRLTRPNDGNFIGLGNYSHLLDDPQFYTTLQVTIVYTLATVVIGVLLGVISALAMDRPFRGRSILRAILLFGWAVPNVAATLIWLWMFNGPSGVLNTTALALGLDRIPWLTSVQWALPSLLMVTVWQVAPFVMLVVLAALQSVPGEVKEAAYLDGADPLNVFRHVTLPHIMPTVQLVALLVAVWSIRRFDVIYLLTGGGPVGTTSTIVVQLRLTAFEAYDLGLASAYGVVGLALALTVALVNYTFERSRERRAAK